jgi:hypothetical protein
MAAADRDTQPAEASPPPARHRLTGQEPRRRSTLRRGILARALALAVEVETLAAQYWRALQIGKPAILSKKEMTTVLAKFSTYGRQD